jgi:hypothetical protein
MPSLPDTCVSDGDYHLRANAAFGYVGLLLCPLPNRMGKVARLTPQPARPNMKTLEDWFIASFVVVMLCLAVKEWRQLKRRMREREEIASQEHEERKAAILKQLGQ